VTETTRSASATSLGFGYDDFLYAAIGEDTNGALLTVLSALARLDVDPWEEAARLAQLPREAATLKLTTLIAALPQGPTPRADPTTLVPRLIALLSPRTVAEIPSHKPLRGIGAATQPAAINWTLYLIFLVIVLLGQYFIVNHRAPAQLDKSAAVTSSPASPQSATPSARP
jgi:hypothetical protein